MKKILLIFIITFIVVFSSAGLLTLLYNILQNLDELTKIAIIQFSIFIGVFAGFLTYIRFYK